MPRHAAGNLYTLYKEKNGGILSCRFCFWRWGLTAEGAEYAEVALRKLLTDGF
jgi:hypothetical protein